MRAVNRVALADRLVPFPEAARWAGLFSGQARERGNKVSCPFCLDGGGHDPAFRVYEDGGYCFAGCGAFRVTRLLAQTWGVTREEAAERALTRIGWKPPTVENLWRDALADPEPARKHLAEALSLWCGSICPLWKTRQYDPEVSRAQALCLSLLPLVRTREDCSTWLEASKEIMKPLLAEQPAGPCLL
jgi:hypothetical protein